MKLSKLYGLQIESEDKKTRGYILGIRCVNDRIEGYICCDQHEREFFCRAEDVEIKKGAARFFKRGEASGQGFLLALGRAVFTHDGKYIGNLYDCTEKNGRILTARIGRADFDFCDLYIGDAIILKSAELAAKNMFIAAVCGG